MSELVQRVATALSGKTRSFGNEIRLHQEISAALTAAGIEHQREVLAIGGRIDFVIERTAVMEVKISSTRGTGPLHQLGGYLEDPRFTLGILLSVRPSSQWTDRWRTEDGRSVPIHYLDLWKNAL